MSEPYDIVARVISQKGSYGSYAVEKEAELLAASGHFQRGEGSI